MNKKNNKIKPFSWGATPLNLLILLLGLGIPGMEQPT